jgi:hypothetical protein
MTNTFELPPAIPRIDVLVYAMHSRDCKSRARIEIPHSLDMIRSITFVAFDVWRFSVHETTESVALSAQHH